MILLLLLLGNFHGLVQHDFVGSPHLLAAGDDLLRREEETVALVSQLSRVHKTGAEAGVPIIGGAGVNVYRRKQNYT